MANVKGPNLPNVDVKITWQAGVALAVIAVAAVGGLMYGIPRYRVWAAEMSGRAELAQAEFNKQIITVEAEANLEAERLNAEAEVIRAQGAADAMYAVQDALTETYIHYLWVRNIANNPNVIYVPTEAGLPILEAGRRQD
ncbi:hypothetical protein FWC63_00210 [Candidatus Saccharibacteria bacterium]|nr:hypothetical protein [Candidatus Saccharibacteria bacterium]